MKYYLLDTNALIWFLHGSKRLGKGALTLLLNRNLHVIVSLAAIDDIIHKNGRLGGRRDDLPPPLIVLTILTKSQNVLVCPINAAIKAQALRLEQEDRNHRDPQDLLHLATFIVLRDQLGARGDCLHYVGTDHKIIARLAKKQLGNLVIRCDR